MGVRGVGGPAPIVTATLLDEGLGRVLAADLEREPLQVKLSLICAGKRTKESVEVVPHLNRGR